MINGGFIQEKWLAYLYDFQCSSSKITRSAMEWSSGQNPDLKEGKNFFSELQRMTLKILSLRSLSSMVLRSIFVNGGECSRPVASIVVRFGFFGRKKSYLGIQILSVTK